MGKSRHQGRQRKDKYYKLAKEQGYRARSAFKLIQLNKRFDFLSNSQVALDLCAAPGGWLQVCAKYMPVSSTIIGLDLDAIKPIRNVKTFVEDITTAKCRQTLKRELHGQQADVVLHDGAPNVGQSWAKDAFGQSELVLHALKLATEFLRRDGWFVTKVFRSADYTALLWVFNQLFRKVHATKPVSSRNSSAEIFVVCQSYLAPDRIDPRMLDPRHVFEQVEGSKPVLSVLHPKADDHRRHRDGYDTTLGMTLHRSMSVADFVHSDDPIRVLSESNELVFDDASAAFREHPHTTEEVRECLKDLKLLNKADFRGLLRWRLRMRDAHAKATAQLAAAEESKVAGGQGGSEGEDSEGEEGAGDEAMDADAADDAEVEAAILRFKEKMEARKRKEKKKARRDLAKKRVQQALGMNNVSVDEVQQESIFSLSTIRSADHLQAVGEVDLGNAHDASAAAVAETLAEGEAQPGPRRGKRVMKLEEWDEEDEAEYLRVLEAEMETQFADFKARRAKREQMREAELQTRKGIKGKRLREEVTLTKLVDEAVIGGDHAPQGGVAEAGEEDGEDASDDDDAAQGGRGNPLLVSLRGDRALSVSARAARWFSSDVFQGAEEEFQALEATARRQQAEQVAMDGAGSDDGEQESEDEEESEEEGAPLKRRRLDLGELPLTDREKRKEKRKRSEERKQRRLAKRHRKDDAAGGYEEVPLSEDEDEAGAANGAVSEKEKQVRDMIRAGMGRALEAEEDGEAAGGRGKRAGRLETVPQGFVPVPAAGDSDSDDGEAGYGEGRNPLALPTGVVPARTHDDVEVGSEEHIQLLALGTAMLRHSKAKEVLDAGYSRYAWNDDDALPTWFAEDERMHNRPQMPVTKEMVDKIRARFHDLANKPIKKVAEARARKRKRAMVKVAKMKKQLESAIESDDAPDRGKLRAMAKAMHNAKVKRPNKVYMVANKAKAGGGKRKSKYGVKMVDRRLKKDKRAAKANGRRSAKK